MQTVTFDRPFELARGGTLPSVTVAYETYGTLSPRRDNAVLVCHALSGDSHVAAHDADDDPGWWDLMVGPGKPIDTDHVFVICPNVLGGCRGTTGPGSINPATGKPWGKAFPQITIEDMVDAQARLVDYLGIDKLLAVAGGSLGGHQTLSWATRYPHRMKLAIALATSARLGAQALAFDVIGRNAILRDPHYADGQYYGQSRQPNVGLAIARMLGHITYLSPEGMDEKFDADRNKPRDVSTDFEKEFSVGSYLAHQGDRFVERFDANSYLMLSMAMDLFDLGSDHDKLAATFAKATCDWLIVSFSSDWLFPPSQSSQVVGALVANDATVSYMEVTTEGGHDAFLLEPEIARMGRAIRARLKQHKAGDPDQQQWADNTAIAETSIYASQRLDYDTIIQLIAPGASVLDLGCGQGGLLAQLKERGHEKITGIEVVEADILTSMQRGLSVIDHDLNTGLSLFGDGQYDVVVLSQTLQAVDNVVGLIREMLRVGRRAIISFPNFAYQPLRDMFFKQGKLPKAPGGYDFDWYDTPNRRFPTILDFDELCQEQALRVDQAVYLDASKGAIVHDDPNRYADTAVYVLGRA